MAAAALPYLALVLSLWAALPLRGQDSLLWALTPQHELQLVQPSGGVFRTVARQVQRVALASPRCALLFMQSGANNPPSTQWFCLGQPEPVPVQPPADSLAPMEMNGGLVPARSSGRWGYLDSTGRWAIAPQFLAARRFSEGLAPVQTHYAHGFGYLRPNGKWWLKPKLHQAFPFSHHRALTERNEVLAYLNRWTRKPMALPGFEQASDFSGGWAVLQLADGFTWTDTLGRLLSEKRYDDAFVFSDGVALAQQNGKWGLVDSLGQTALAFAYDRVLPLSRRWAVAEVQNRWQVLQNRNGRFEPDERMEPFTELLAASEAWLLAERTGTRLAIHLATGTARELRYPNTVLLGRSSLAAVIHNRLVGLQDLGTGQVLLEPAYIWLAAAF